MTSSESWAGSVVTELSAVKVYVIVAMVSVGIGGCSAVPPRAPSGALTFATHCAACHGEYGAGDGPVAATLDVGAPDLRTLTMWYGQFPADATASAVPGAQSSQQRIDAIIVFLRELQTIGR